MQNNIPTWQIIWICFKAQFKMLTFMMILICLTLLLPHKMIICITYNIMRDFL